MNRSTTLTVLACLTAAHILLFTAAAAVSADEPQAADANQPVDPKPVTATIRLDGLQLDLRNAEAKQADAAGLVLSLDNATNAQPRFWLGLALANPDDVLRLHLGIAPGTSLIVTGVENDSPAAKAGVMVNDLLLKLEGKPVASVEALAKQIQEIGEKSVPLELLRRGRPAMLTVSPEKRIGEGLVVQLGNLQLENLEFIPAVAVAAEPVTIDLELSDSVFELDAPCDDLAKRVAELQEQVKLLQKSIDALDAALKAKSAADGAGKK